jgi:L-2,4-diaminobutyrate decarboxylase
MTTPPFASTPDGPDALQPLLHTVLNALRDGGHARHGRPLPPGGPDTITTRITAAIGDVLPEQGDPHALHTLIHALAENSTDPAHPHSTAHLHCPPLAIATAADLAASALNQSLDSWDQAPAATTLETTVTRTLAHTLGLTDALVTTGGTESNHLALLLARETQGNNVRLVHGTNAHHSLPRAAWLLGLPEPVTIPTPTGTLDPTTLHHTLNRTPPPTLVAATAGTTDAGLIDPLPEIADICTTHGARLHIDAAYGGPLTFSTRHRHKLTGLETAHTVTLDLHKLGWQPAAAGLLALADPNDLTTLHHHTDYLNADDDTQAGLPDLLNRSLRTTRRPDILKIAVTLKTLGRTGLGNMIDQLCDHAHQFATHIHNHPHFDLYRPPTISTVLFRPTNTTDTTVAHIRRTLLHNGTAILGRARPDGRLWLKTTLLNPYTHPHELTHLLELVKGTTPE